MNSFRVALSERITRTVYVNARGPKNAREKALDGDWEHDEGWDIHERTVYSVDTGAFPILPECEACHKSIKEAHYVKMELNQSTLDWSLSPIAKEVSQGWFEFHPRCAEKVLRKQWMKPTTAAVEANVKQLVTDVLNSVRLIKNNTRSL